jgi:glycosyltransferase involved in cell wall biosynthesis
MGREASIEDQNTSAGASSSSDTIADVPAIAIVIPTRNEEKNLGRLLQSIRGQNIHSEVVIVDQQSADRTVEIARDYGCAIVECPPPAFYSPPGLNRNLGAAATAAGILLHLDADMELPTSDFLTRLIGCITDEHRALIIHELDVASGFWSKCKALERRCYWNTPMEAARAVRRDLFVAVGGYDVDISSGEDFFISALYDRATSVTHDDGMFLLHHVGAQSLVGLLKKKYRYGKTARTYVRKASRTGQRPVSRIVVASIYAYMRNTTFLWEDPLHYIGMFPLRLMEFVMVRAGMIAGGSYRYSS